MPTQSRKSRARMELDEPDFIWDCSSSEEEDWGDGSWEVDGITEEHVNTREELRFKVAWGGWQREDGSNWTWENKNGATMQDVPNVLKRWLKDQDNETNEKVDSPLVAPFMPSTPRQKEESSDEGKKAKSKKRAPAVYTFTEQANQARQAAIDRKDEADFEESSSLASAAVRLRELREKRASALKALDVELSEAPSLCLYGLGPAPKKGGRYKAQKKVPLYRHMESLHVSKRAQKSGTNLGNSIPSKPVKAITRPATFDPSTAKVRSFDSVFDRQERPVSKHPQVPSRASRPLPPRTPQSQQVQPALPPKPSSQFAPPPSSSAAGKGSPDVTIASDAKRKRKVPSTSSLATGVGSSSAQNRPTAPARPKPLSPRKVLQMKWSATIRAAGAASVTFVNDFNDEAIPPLDMNKFTYLESEYIFASGVTRSEEAFMESCDCTAGCKAPFCPCQDDSEILDDDTGAKDFAYDANGLFTFASITSYVIECNKNCLCNASCRSRVAQRPRTFPIEVFRTERCGWGVRSTVALPKGTVLGVYTGELIPRETAKSFSAKRASYVFDLDFMNSGLQSGYSVDAYNCGSWTRFVNHSCEPVCALYPVIWDSVPSMHQPKLAFVTNTDVPARQELTIDYCPQARKGKGKGRAKVSGTPDCLCGAEYCRGFIYLR